MKLHDRCVAINSRQRVQHKINGRAILALTVVATWLVVFAPNASVPLLAAAGGLIQGTAQDFQALVDILPPLIPTGLSFANIQQVHSWGDFRFKKEDLPALGNAMRIPAEFLVPRSRHNPRRGHMRIPGDEAFLLFLNRMAYPSRWRNQEQMFGRYYWDLSKIFYTVLDHIIEEHSWRLTTGLWRFRPLVEDCRNAVAKYVDKYIRQNGGGAVPADATDVWGFLDGCLRPTCRPRDEVLWNGIVLDLQREMYSGHKHLHGFKYQGVTLPNGIIADLFGPAVGRRNDNWLVYASALPQRLAHMLGGMVIPPGRQYKLYGDSIYRRSLYITRASRLAGAALPAGHAIGKKALNAARTCVEWSFGWVPRFWAGVDFAKKLKVHEVPVGKLYIAAVLLTNARTCLYGSMANEVFDMLPPTLEWYFQ